MKERYFHHHPISSSPFLTSRKHHLSFGAPYITSQTLHCHTFPLTQPLPAHQSSSEVSPSYLDPLLTLSPRYPNPSHAEPQSPAYPDALPMPQPSTY
ncbi:hypothetical protein E2C01_086403 [Portunus trituberculatus]|uniref:Uncharacterized protein n=1 Tax=Portunus trituberculatus TaxID=210409 RepID=A0A5B7J0P6_PORTR|nr:hypothetical protein [Portunus trituberculatus]